MLPAPRSSRHRAGRTTSGQIRSAAHQAYPDRAGQVAFTSDRSKKSGTVTATIGTITPPAGAQYDATIYGEPLQRSVRFN